MFHRNIPLVAKLARQHLYQSGDQKQLAGKFPERGSAEFQIASSSAMSLSDLPGSSLRHTPRGAAPDQDSSQYNLNDYQFNHGLESSYSMGGGIARGGVHNAAGPFVSSPAQHQHARAAHVTLNPLLSRTRNDHQTSSLLKASSAGCTARRKYAAQGGGFQHLRQHNVAGTAASSSGGGAIAYNQQLSTSQHLGTATTVSQAAF